MKFNWRVLVGFVVLVGVAFWGVDSLRTRSYSGTDLSFGVGGGPVTLTNPSASALPVQLVGSGTRSFTISSAADGVSGSATREGSGRSAVQSYVFELPPGITEFTVARGTDVTFVVSGDTRLEASVQPLNADNANTTLIVTALAILGALFYMSRATGHQWISLLRRDKLSLQKTQPHAASAGDA